MNAWPAPTHVPPPAPRRGIAGKVALGVFLGLLAFGGACTVLVGGAAVVGSQKAAEGVCDDDGCSTRDAAVEAAREHLAARSGHPATGVCLRRGGDGWWSWSLTAAGCDLPAVWAPLP